MTRRLTATTPIALALALTAAASCEGASDAPTATAPSDAGEDATRPPPPGIAGAGANARTGGGVVEASLPDFGSCKPPARTGAAYVLVPAFGGRAFDLPVELIEGPNGRFYVVEQKGVVKAIPTGAGDPTVVVDLTDRVFSTGECGLLGLAFDPGFADNGWVYLSYVVNDPGAFESVISRFTSHDGGLTLDRATEKRVLHLPQPYGNHKGGRIAFGPDRMLYIGFGDGGSGDDPLGNGQNKDVLLGKILRIDPNGGDPYATPPGNPFVAGGGRPEIWAYGLRNPWKFSFDRLTGDLWCADVGQSGYEEVDRIVPGGNYGWSVREGRHCSATAPDCVQGTTIDPVAEYSHAAQEGISVTGGYVYRGAKAPALAGKFVYGDYGYGNVWAVGPGDANGTLILRTPLQISTFGQGRDGEIYVADYVTGTIDELLPSSSIAVGEAGSSLAKTGCVDPASATPPPGAIAYSINSPLWSDGAAKERWVFVRDGGRIGVGPDGDLELPPASVAVKSFLIYGKRVETRLLVRYGDGTWAGYAYEWAEDGSDAVLLDNRKTKTVAGWGPWTFPAPEGCFACHTAAAGTTLGLEARQLDRIEPDAGAGANVLDRFAGVLATPLATGAFPALVAVDAPDASADARARSYLHANCSMCHRPGGGTPVTMDLRSGLTLAATHTCNALPLAGDLSVAGAKIVVPGSPATSLLPLRMRAVDGTAKDEMPPLGTRIVDDVAVTAVEDWITQLTACP